MIVDRFQNNLIYAYLLLTTLIHTVAAQPFCTAFYGVPDSESCNELLHGDNSPTGYTGIGNTDHRDHLFGLPHILRPPHTTDEQWDNKVNLPIIRANRKPINPSNQHLLSPPTDNSPKASANWPSSPSCPQPRGSPPTQATTPQSPTQATKSKHTASTPATHTPKADTA